jgi:hypothetical protein
MIYAMTQTAEQIVEEMRRLVDEYRSRCLWFIRPDYYPRTPRDILRILDYICRYGDTRAYKKALEIKKWHLQNIKEPSVNCFHQTG